MYLDTEYGRMPLGQFEGKQSEPISAAAIVLTASQALLVVLHVYFMLPQGYSSV